MSVCQTAKRRRTQARNEQLGPKLSRVWSRKTTKSMVGGLGGKISKTARKSGAK